MRDQDWTDINEELHQLREENKQLREENKILRGLLSYHGSHSDDVRNYLEALSSREGGTQTKWHGITQAIEEGPHNN